MFMSKLLSILAFIAFLSSCGPTKTIDCPPKFTIYKNVEKAYPTYTKELDLGIKNSLNAIDKIQDTLSLSVKTKVVKLRQDLDNISSRIQMLTISNLQSYYAGICDPNRRKSFDEFQNKLAELTLKVSQVATNLDTTRSNQTGEQKIDAASIKTQEVLEDIGKSAEK